jgi:hypothetical protein
MNVKMLKNKFFQRIIYTFSIGVVFPFGCVENKNINTNDFCVRKEENKKKRRMKNW